MTAQWRGRIRGLVIGAIAVAYAVLAHISNSAPQARALGVLLAASPIAAALVIYLWRTGWRIAATAAAVAALIVLARAWPLLSAHFSWLYLAQQAGAYGLLALVFGRSLRAGREPLCTRLADIVHGPLSPALVRYTRQVTAAWTLLFGLITAALVLAFVLLPLPVWSAFANFGAFALVVAMFIGEYVVRGRVVPEAPHPGILAGVRAFIHAGSGAAAPRG